MNSPANAFFGFNYQRREFRDFHAWESQNWLMGVVERRGQMWQVRGLAMLTFEPFSLGAVGSPQVFQTGETYRNAPIIDYPHPHDLVMQLGGHAPATAVANPRTSFNDFDRSAFCRAEKWVHRRCIAIHGRPLPGQ